MLKNKLFYSALTAVGIASCLSFWPMQQETQPFPKNERSDEKTLLMNATLNLVAHSDAMGYRDAEGQGTVFRKKRAPELSDSLTVKSDRFIPRGEEWFREVTVQMKGRPDQTISWRVAQRSGKLWTGDNDHPLSSDMFIQSGAPEMR